MKNLKEIQNQTNIFSLTHNSEIEEQKCSKKGLAQLLGAEP